MGGARQGRTACVHAGQGAPFPDVLLLSFFLPPHTYTHAQHNKTHTNTHAPLHSPSSHPPTYPSLLARRPQPRCHARHHHIEWGIMGDSRNHIQGGTGGIDRRVKECRAALCRAMPRRAAPSPRTKYYNISPI